MKITPRKISLTRRWLAVLGAAALGMLPAGATRVVNSLLDTLTPPSGKVTLRSALAQASSGETIRFDASLDGCTIPLSIVGEEHSTLVGEIMGINETPSGPISYLVGYFERDYGKSALYARKNVVIDASALPQGITLEWTGGDANPARVLAVYGNLTMKNVAITGGRSVAVALPTPDPGAQYGQLSTRARGGGVAVWGVAHLEKCRLYGNKCSRSATVPVRDEREGGVFGGGIYADIVEISDSVISGNSLTAPGVSGGGVFAVGGAVASASVSTIDRSSITGNGIAGIYAYGGGAYSDGGGIGKSKKLELRNCTIAANRVGISGPSFLWGIGYWRGGGVYMSNGNLSIRSCTIVHNEVHGAARTIELGKSNLAGGVAATIGNAHAVESMIIGHSIIAGNTVHETSGTVYQHDIFTGSLFEFISEGRNRIGVIDFRQILIPLGRKTWYSLSRKHYPKTGDLAGVSVSDVLDLDSGVTRSSHIRSAGVGPSLPVPLRYAPAGSAIDQVPAASHQLTIARAEYEVASGADNFLEIMLGRIENRYGLAGFAAAFKADFEAFLASVDTDSATAGNQPYTDPGGAPILTLADTLWHGPAETWPSQLSNYPLIEFWHRLDTALLAANIPGMGPELIGDAAWLSMFTFGTLTENPNISFYIWTSPHTVQPLTTDQTGATRPVNTLGDIGAVEYTPPMPPILHWTLEEGTGTTTAESVSGATSASVLTGDTAWTGGIAPGSTSAVSLGATGSINAGTLKANGTFVAGSDPSFAVSSNRWAITAWIHLPPRQGLAGDRIIASSDAAPTSTGWRFFTRENADSTDSPGFEFAGTRVQTTLRIPPDTDVFVAVCADSSGVSGSTQKHRFAVWDGSAWQFATGTAFSNIRLQGIELGAFNSAAAFHGTIDDARIYGLALNQENLDFLSQADTDADGTPDFLDTDDDNDGLTDTAEAAIGTNAKSADTDGDGASDRDEVRAGTLPTSAASRLRVESITRPGTQVTLRWTSSANRSYSLWAASDLGAGGWTRVTSGIAATPPLNQQSVESTEERRFFRIGVE